MNATQGHCTKTHCTPTFHARSLHYSLRDSNALFCAIVVAALLLVQGSKPESANHRSGGAVQWDAGSARLVSDMIEHLKYM